MRPLSANLHVTRLVMSYVPGFIVRRSLLEFLSSADILAEFVAYQYYLRVLTTYAASRTEHLLIASHTTISSTNRSVILGIRSSFLTLSPSVPHPALAQSYLVRYCTPFRVSSPSHLGSSCVGVIGIIFV